MSTQRKSLLNLKGSLSREEMKKIAGGNDTNACGMLCGRGTTGCCPGYRCGTLQPPFYIATCMPISA